MNSPCEIVSASEHSDRLTAFIGHPRGRPTRAKLIDSRVIAVDVSSWYVLRIYIERSAVLTGFRIYESRKRAPTQSETIAKSHSRTALDVRIYSAWLSRMI